MKLQQATASAASAASASALPVAAAGIANDLQSQVELRVSCKRLPCKDLLSKSDPMIVLHMQNNARQYQRIGKTEWISNDQNPTFNTPFVMTYHFESNQHLLFEVWDVDSDAGSTDHADFLGQLKITLGEIVAAPGQSITRTLTDRHHKNVAEKSTITIKCEELKCMNETLIMNISGIGLDKKDTFGSSDPYLEFYRIREDNTWSLVHTTEVIKDTLNPNFKPIVINMATLNAGDYRRPIMIKCWDWDRFMENDLIGECTFTVAELVSMLQPPPPPPAASFSSGGQFALFPPNSSAASSSSSSSGLLCIRKELIHPDKKKKDKYKNSGVLQFAPPIIQRQHTFLDYLAGGCEMNLIVAIDFTGSNGDPRQPNSLHYLGNQNGAFSVPAFMASPSIGNEYQKATTMVSSILLPYASQPKFTAFGFGGKFNGATSHCFPLTLDYSRPDVVGVEGIVSAYANALSKVALSGPTYFSEILQQTEAIVSSKHSNPLQQSYSILMILTDGIINDLDATVASLVRLSYLPVSVIIVGVGGEDFSTMRFLDGDDTGGLNSNGTKAERDNVQFVAFRQFSNVADLTAETLKEVPQQFLNFMKKRNISPLPPRAVVVAPSPQPSPPASPQFHASNTASAAQLESNLKAMTLQPPAVHPYSNASAPPLASSHHDPPSYSDLPPSY